MSKKTRTADEIMKRRLDLQLDRELEDTFPASDAPKVTRTSHPTSLHAPAEEVKPVLPPIDLRQGHDAN